MDKYGFVYRWYDRKRDRFYIGRHWGTDFDGYICSSNWMRNSYKKRPEDFTREILRTNIKTKKETQDEELMWLQMIKKEELGKRYYNLRNDNFGIIEHTEKTKQKISHKNKGRPSWHKGRKRTEETRKKISDSKIGKSLPTDHINSMSKANKGKHISPMTEFKKGNEGYWKGKHRSEATKQKLSLKNKEYRHTEEAKKKISEKMKLIRAAQREVKTSS